MNQPNHLVISVILCFLLFFAGFGIIPATAGVPGEVAYAYSKTTLNLTALCEGENISVSPVSFPGELFTEGSSPVKEAISESSYPDYVPGSVLVIYETDNRKTASSSFDSAALSANGAIGATVTQEFTDGVLPGCQVVSLSDDMTVDEAVIYYEGLPGVAFAQPNYLYTIDAVPNDPDYSLQWGLQNTGQATLHFPSGVTAGADISAEGAWDTTTGSEDIVIAVIDTGVDYLHADLAANMWDDGAGHHGYDFVNNDDDPMDDKSHGTHCAGIIGAVGNNGVGVTGVCWDTRIMALKAFNADGEGTSTDEIEAINYAVTHGADILSCSWGGTGYDPALKAAIDNSGLFVVCAAGNDAVDNDAKPHYPSSYDSPNIISVAATAPDDSLSYFSNYGATSVDVGAPGTDIYSTIPGETSMGTLVYGYKSGTSMATPMVAGVAGLILAKNSSYTPADLKAAIMDNTDPIPPLAGKCVTGGRVNAWAAVDYITPLIRGDFNGNGWVDIGDVSRVAWMVAGLTPVDMRADFNGDGIVDGADGALIAYYYVGKINVL